jgi:hypothetical protein
MVTSKLGQRLVGLLILLVAGGFTAWIWHTALTEGTYYRKAAALFPAFAVIGLGMLLFPTDVDRLREVIGLGLWLSRLRAERGVEKVMSLNQIPPVWWGVLVAAVAAGLGNWYALSQL